MTFFFPILKHTSPLPTHGFFKKSFLWGLGVVTNRLPLAPVCALHVLRYSLLSFFKRIIMRHTKLFLIWTTLLPFLFTKDSPTSCLLISVLLSVIWNPSFHHISQVLACIKLLLSDVAFFFSPVGPDTAESKPCMPLGHWLESPVSHMVPTLPTARDHSSPQN